MTPFEPPRRQLLESPVPLIAKSCPFFQPSRPSDRRQGPRAETMLQRDSTSQQQDPYLRHSAPPSGGQFTNYAYVPDSQPSMSPSHSESQRRWVKRVKREVLALKKKIFSFLFLIFF